MLSEPCAYWGIQEMEAEGEEAKAKSPEPKEMTAIGFAFALALSAWACASRWATTDVHVWATPEGVYFRYAILSFVHPANSAIVFEARDHLFSVRGRRISLGPKSRRIMTISSCGRHLGGFV